MPSSLVLPLTHITAFTLNYLQSTYRFAAALATAAQTAAAAVKTVVVSGGCMAIPALLSAVTAAFPKAAVVTAGPCDATTGAALLLASDRGLLG